MVWRHTCSPVTRRSTPARQAQAAPGAHVGQSATKTPSKRATRLAIGPRSAWAARWQVGREHCLSRNVTKRHELATFASHFRDRVHLKKREPLEVRLISTRRRPPRIFCHTSAHVPEETFHVRGCCRVHTVGVLGALGTKKRVWGPGRSNSSVQAQFKLSRRAWVCPSRFVTRIARRLLDLSPSSASLVHGASLTSEVSLWFVVGLSCGVGATRDGPMRPATRGSPPTTKQRRALEPGIQSLPAPNSAAVAPPYAPPPSARRIADSAHRRRPGRGCAGKCSL